MKINKVLTNYNLQNQKHPFVRTTHSGQEAGIYRFMQQCHSKRVYVTQIALKFYNKWFELMWPNY